MEFRHALMPACLMVTTWLRIKSGGKCATKHYGNALSLLLTTVCMLRAGVNNIFPLRTLREGCAASTPVRRCCHEGKPASVFRTTHPFTLTQQGLLAALYPSCLTCSLCICLPNEFIIIPSSREKQPGDRTRKSSNQSASNQKGLIVSDIYYLSHRKTHLISSLQ